MNTDALRDTWVMFQREHGCSVDRMLCNPQLRNQLLAAAYAIVPGADEEQILWCLVGQRKKKALPRTQQ